MSVVSSFFRGLSHDFVECIKNHESSSESEKSLQQVRISSVCARVLGLAAITAGSFVALSSLTIVPVVSLTVFPLAPFIISVLAVTVAASVVFGHDALVVGNNMHDFVARKENLHSDSPQQVADGVWSAFKKVGEGVKELLTGKVGIEEGLSKTSYNFNNLLNKTWVLKPLFKVCGADMTKDRI